MKSNPDSRQVQRVKQIIECNDLAATNIFLQSGDWILLNSYHNRLYGQKPTYCLGRIRKYETEDNGVNESI